MYAVIIATTRLCCFQKLLTPIVICRYLCHLNLVIFRFLNPFGMFLGGAVVTLVFMGSVWAGENKAIIKNFKKKNPTLFVIGVMGTSYFLLSLCGGVMVFIFGLTFPLLRESYFVVYTFKAGMPFDKPFSFYLNQQSVELKVSMLILVSSHKLRRYLDTLFLSFTKFHSQEKVTSICSLSIFQSLMLVRLTT